MSVNFISNSPFELSYSARLPKSATTFSIKNKWYRVLVCKKRVAALQKISSFFGGELKESSTFLNHWYLFFESDEDDTTIVIEGKD
jgi:hypothetical protein